MIADRAESIVKRLFDDMKGSYFAAPDPAIRDYTSADESAYGLLGLLILLPLLAVTIVRRRGPPWQRILALAAVSYFLAYTLSLGYNTETGRYLIPAAALAAPLLGALARRNSWAAVALVLTFATLPAALLHDVGKPVLASQDSASIFTLDRIDQQTMGDDIEPALRRLDALVAPREALGFVYQDNLVDYYLFGEPLQRRLVGFHGTGVTAKTLRANGLRALFIGYADQPPCVGRLCIRDPAGLRWTRLAGSYLATVP
jgi:hypothetical protein